MGYKSLLVSLVALVFAVVAVVLVDDGRDIPKRTESPAAAVTFLPEADVDTVAEDVPSDSLEELMSHPNVVRYLEREARKERLHDYFSDLDDSSADEAWRLIDEIEQDGGMMAYEALALKLAWLEKNSADKAAFDRASKSLLEEYRERSQQASEQYDPYRDVPGFARYKDMEKSIIAEVQGMENFPDGMTRQEYLRSRLQIARESAFSQ